MRIFLCLILYIGGVITVKSQSSITETSIEPTNKVLFILSNAHFYGNSKINTSNHFAEIVWAYDEFKKEGYTVDFVSPEGGAVPLGYIETADSIMKAYLYDNDFMNLLKNTNKPSQIYPENYGAVYYVGGGAAMFGIAENKEIQQIVMAVYESQQGVLSALCHGTAGIVNLKTQNGDYVVADKRISGFPDDFENTDAAYYQEFPFSIQQKIEEHGGTFIYSEEGWDGFYSIDDRLITGQDPTSAAIVAQKIIETLAKQKSKNP